MANAKERQAAAGDAVSLDGSSLTIWNSERAVAIEMLCAAQRPWTVASRQRQAATALAGSRSAWSSSAVERAPLTGRCERPGSRPW